MATVTDAAQQVVAVVEHAFALQNLGRAGQALGHVGEIDVIGCGAAVAGDNITGNQLVSVKTGIGVITCLVLDHGVAIAGRQVVEELVTMQYQGELGAVRLCYLGGCRIGGNCTCS